MGNARGEILEQDYCVDNNGNCSDLLTLRKATRAKSDTGVGGREVRDWSSRVAVNSRGTRQGREYLDRHPVILRGEIGAREFASTSGGATGAGVCAHLLLAFII